MTMHVDIETYSSIDIREAGVYAYASAPDFEILLIGYRYDGQDVKVIDLTDRWRTRNGISQTFGKACTVRM